jgi:aldose 1-epimerase
VDGLQAEILTLGGTLRSLTLPVGGRRIPLVLSLPDLPAILKDTSYLGLLVGRYGTDVLAPSFLALAVLMLVLYVLTLRAAARRV